MAVTDNHRDCRPGGKVTDQPSASGRQQECPRFENREAWGTRIIVGPNKCGPACPTMLSVR